MDLDQQEALNAIENSVYRTALKLCAVQSVCQLDVTDTFLIQHILPNRRCQAEKQSLLPVDRLFNLLKELFQRARLEKPGQVDPQAPVLTLRLLTAAYDRNRAGFVQQGSAAAALIALSGDALLTKYRAFFQLYATCTGKSSNPSACITRSGVRNLLTDLLQLLAIVGERRDPSNVEIATHNPDLIYVEYAGERNIHKQLCTVSRAPLGRRDSWNGSSLNRRSSAGSQPATDCPRTKMVVHRVTCNVCGRFPINGLRYRCLKCLDFDLCQVCFFTGQDSKSHKKSHPVVEHCVPASAKENTKLFFRIVRNNLQPGRCKKKEAMRREALAAAGGGDTAAHSQTRPCSIQSISLGQPVAPIQCCSPHTGGTQLRSPLATQVSQAPKREDDSRSSSQDITHSQVLLAALKDESAKAQESLQALRHERRSLTKQLNKWKRNVQVFHSTQEAKNGTLETRLHEAIATQEHLKTELRQMGIEMKKITLCWNKPSEKTVQNGSGGPPLKPIYSKLLRHKSLAISSSCSERIQLLEPQARLLAGIPRTPEIAQQAECFQNGSHEDVCPEKPKETRAPLTNHPGDLDPETTRGHLSRRIEISKSPPPPPVMKALLGKTQAEQEELQWLMMKLKDSLSFQVEPGHPSALKQELLSGAKRVSQAFSDLIGQVTLPIGKCEGGSDGGVLDLPARQGKDDSDRTCSPPNSA
ncbi:hypothetical protein JRQ81_001370 [Phrynocephalus forsythii]|uniref:ZZ-type domain-containing protein n=1 Tax=Phrynocephalus forsythii TaxID=171643 RepID=A0A9Q1B8X5_9SAUR|nr:hypothetical protein JRQ81_001370 [Phrynocephalus forsythii]